MELAVADWIVIVVFIALTLAIGLCFSRKVGKDINNFFLAGRNFPWWIAGVSMAATTFAADTPLAVTELVAHNGIAGNWMEVIAYGLGSLEAFFILKKTSDKVQILADEEKKEVAA